MKLQQGITEQARQTLARANDEARDFHHEYIGTEHILLAVVAEGAGIGAEVLRALGITSDLVRTEIEKLVHRGPESASVAKRPLTPRAQEAVDFARQEALYTCQGLVDTEHLLLGLLREPGGVAGVVLRRLGLSLEATREEVLKIRVLQMKIVERAVRPVRSALARRMKMREELLAHLTEIYEQERAKGNSPLQATTAAERRFGDPAELSRELQASVPRIERWEANLDRRFGRRAAESTARYLTRTTVQMFLGMTFVTIICIGLCVSRFGWNLNALIASRVFFAMQVLMPTAFLALSLHYYEMRNTWYGVFGRRRSRARLCLLIGSFTLIVMIAGCSLTAFSAWSWEPVGFVQWFLLTIGLVSAVATLVIARDNGPNEIRDGMWSNLDLES